jgi:hypothetical protein
MIIVLGSIVITFREMMDKRVQKGQRASKERMDEMAETE